MRVSSKQAGTILYSISCATATVARFGAVEKERKRLAMRDVYIHPSLVIHSKFSRGTHPPSFRSTKTLCSHSEMIQSQTKRKKREMRDERRWGRRGAGLSAYRRENGLSVMSCLPPPQSNGPDCRQTRKWVQSVLIHAIISSFVRFFPSFQLSHIFLVQPKKSL